MSDEPPALALVITTVADAGVLAGSLRLAGVGLAPGTVVIPTSRGAVVAARTPVDRAGELATAVSRVLREVPVVLLTGASGQLSATRWAAGAAGESIPPGLLVSTLDDVVESMLLGATPPQEAPGGIEVTGLGRWRAARLVAGARRGR